MEKLPDEGMAEETREGTAAEVTKISKNVNGGHKGWHEREGTWKGNGGHELR